MKKFYQCHLSTGNSHQIAYIEERGAKVGSKVELGGKGTNDFWNVDSVSDKFLLEHQLKGIQDSYHKGFASI